MEKIRTFVAEIRRYERNEQRRGKYEHHFSGGSRLVG